MDVSTHLLGGGEALLGGLLLGLDGSHEGVDVGVEIDAGAAVVRLAGAGHAVVVSAQVQVTHLLVGLDGRAHLGLDGLASAVQRIAGLRQAGREGRGREGLGVLLVEVLVEVQRLVGEGGRVSGHRGLGAAGLEEGQLVVELGRGGGVGLRRGHVGHGRSVQAGLGVVGSGHAHARHVPLP